MHLLLETEACLKYGRTTTKISVVLTATVLFVSSVLLELISNALLSSVQHAHPILLLEINRKMLSRELLNIIWCGIFVCLGWKHFYLCNDVFAQVLQGKATMENAKPLRLLTYHPAAQLLCIYYLAHVMKNTYDSLIWGAEMEIYAHHILTSLVTWGGATAEYSHFYAPFYFGIADFSTIIFVFFSLFDSKDGIAGLDESFPKTNTIFNVLFVLSFAMFRVILWSIFSIQYQRDSFMALKSKTKVAQNRKGWILYFSFANFILTSLQYVWFFYIISGSLEIILTGKRDKY